VRARDGASGGRGAPGVRRDVSLPCLLAWIDSSDASDRPIGGRQDTVEEGEHVPRAEVGAAKGRSQVEGPACAVNGYSGQWGQRKGMRVGAGKSAAEAASWTQSRSRQHVRRW
jgi:hypothetical protein